MKARCLGFVISVLIVGASIAHAEGSGSSTVGYVGALLGIGMVNNSGGTNFTYGLGGGYKFMPDWSVGADFTYNSFTVPSPLTANLSLILANIKYYFGSGGFAGLKLGEGTVSYSGTGSPGSASNLAWGPTVGYNYIFTDKWSVGGEANLIWISNSNPGVSVFQILANLKYWF